MKRVYVKEEVCIGCHLCEVYCRQKQAMVKDLVKAFKKKSPPSSRVRIEEKGPVSFSVRCQHCDEAPCVSACLTGALARDLVNGVVEVDGARCVGCWTCLLVCPFAAIKQDLEEGRAVKCDLCQGEDIPVCVANCPNEALVYTDTRDKILAS